MKRYFVKFSSRFCNLPTIVENHSFFYSAASDPEEDFRRRFDEEGMQLISVEMGEGKESVLTTFE